MYQGEDDARVDVKVICKRMPSLEICSVLYSLDISNFTQ